MHLKKKAVASATLSALALTISRCGGTSAPVEPEKSLAGKPGIYTATTNGHNGPLKLELAVDEKGIKNLKLLESKETQMVGGFVFDVRSNHFQ